MSIILAMLRVSVMMHPHPKLTLGMRTNHQTKYTRPMANEIIHPHRPHGNSHSKAVDLTGKKFRHITVLGPTSKRTPSMKRIWLCRCDCGVVKEVIGAALSSGKLTSCGCKTNEIISNTNSKHKLSGTPEYKIWKDMRKRCYNPNNKAFHHYGGRGIKVCDRWVHGEGGKHGYVCFFEDMGARPSNGHSVDRINNEGNYEPSNCRWATDTEQARNKSTGIRRMWKGSLMALADICDMEKIPYSRLYTRLRVLGWDIEKAVNTPRVDPRSVKP